MKKLTDFLKNKADKFQKEIDEKTVFHLFSCIIKDEFGNQGQKNIVPTFLKNGIIFVKVQNSIWAQELWLQRNFLVEKLNEKVGREFVKEIKVSG